jgi:hypothetical protein
MVGGTGQEPFVRVWACPELELGADVEPNPVPDEREVPVEPDEVPALEVVVVVPAATVCAAESARW